MPAALPGSTLAQNLANPSLGLNINHDLLSGPKGSPFDRDVQVPFGSTPGGSGYPASGNASTGALATGIGFGSPPIFGLTAPQSIKDAGFTDDYTPGVTNPDGTTRADSALMYIGGGRSDATANAVPNPYTVGFGLGDAGQGGARDAGAGPAFQGFRTKTVTAVGTVANGAVVETGFVNRSGVSITVGQSVFGSAVAASGVVA
jgi:hypothetical protein